MSVASLSAQVNPSRMSPPRVSPPRVSPPQVLARARELVTPVQRAAVSRLAPGIRLPTEYHLGWCEADGQPAAGDRGKCLRPALALLSAEAVGADPALSLPGGAAVELLHNFSLVHDDLMDGDRERRHRPTVWTVFGTGSAIIVGDAMHTLAYQILLDVPGPAGRAATRALSEATAHMIAGQAEDMAFETAARVTVERCLAMEAGKTGAILACASSIGAILAGAPDEVVDALHDFGTHLGLSFQAVDDLLGIWGDPASTGKPVASDLRQHKQSLPVVAALAAGDARRSERAELARLLETVEMSEDEVARAAELVEECGGRSLAGAEAARHLAAALACLDRVDLASGPVTELTELAHFVTDREG
ncbi:MAG: polyprenyl synthetase family protein [Acidimicrobiales bacterium]